MRLGVSPLISAPSKAIVPPSGAYSPAMQLNVVLLPEPLGPIRPRISPSFTSNETLLTARSAPNRLVRPETLNIAMRGIPLARVPDAVQRETVHRRSGIATDWDGPGSAVHHVTLRCARDTHVTSRRRAPSGAERPDPRS